jgi:limonene 1,2-monooxygenase
MQNLRAMCKYMDRAGFDEVWIGEHHSGGWTTLSAPDLLIASLSQEVTSLKMATGVVPLPYHNPLHVAERVMLLDHLTQGRIILGCGTGTYVHDMEMIGLEPTSVRERFEKSLSLVQSLLAGNTTSFDSEWLTLQDATLQLRPRKQPVEVVVASSMGESSLSLLADSKCSPIVNLAPPWGSIRPERTAAPVESLAQKTREYQQMLDIVTAHVRCTVYVHVADSVSAGIDEIYSGWAAQRHGFYRDVLGMPIPGSEAANRKALDALVETGAYIVGDAPTCVAQLNSLVNSICGDLSLIFFQPGWLGDVAAMAQLEVLAGEIIPGVSGELSGAETSLELTHKEAARQMKARGAV